VRARVFTGRPAERALAGAARTLLRVRAVDRGGAGAHVGRDEAVLRILAAGAPRLRGGAAADGGGGLAGRFSPGVGRAAAGGGDDRLWWIAVATDGAAQEERRLARQREEREEGQLSNHRSPAPSARAASCRCRRRRRPWSCGRSCPCRPTTASPSCG